MANPSDARPEWVAVGRVVKTQGRGGELAVEVLSDIPERIESLSAAWLLGRAGQRQRFALERRWPHKGWIILKLAGLDDLSAAEAWVGAEVQVPAAERAPAPEGSYFQSDLAGCDVFDRGQKLGVVESVEAVPGAAALLHVRTPQGSEVLVPFAAAFVAEVALAEHRLALTLPEGLVDLNP